MTQCNYRARADYQVIQGIVVDCWITGEFNSRRGRTFYLLSRALSSSSVCYQFSQLYCPLSLPHVLALFFNSVTLFQHLKQLDQSYYFSNEVPVDT